MSDIYEKLDSEIVEERHLLFLNKLTEDSMKTNLILDLFPPFLSVEDTIIKFTKRLDMVNGSPIMTKMIKDCIGKDNEYFKNHVLGKGNE